MKARISCATPLLFDNVLAVPGRGIHKYRYHGHPLERRCLRHLSEYLRHSHLPDDPRQLRHQYIIRRLSLQQI